MSRTACMTLVLSVLLLTMTSDAKGPKKSDADTQKKGYSGKGIPSNARRNSSKSRFPTQNAAGASYSPSPYSRTTGKKTRRTTTSSASPQPVTSGRSKYSKQRPTTKYPVRTPSQTVQFPQQPTNGRPAQNTTSPSKRPVQQQQSPPRASFYAKPPLVISNQKPTRPTPTTPAPVTRPGTGSKNKPARLPSYPQWSGSHNRPAYPGIRPPQHNRPSQPHVECKPTTIVNQNNTHISNHVTNVNNWFNGNSWKNQVTVNDRHWNGRPWWNRPDYRDWHHGHWHGRYYFRGRDAWRHIDQNDSVWLSGLVSWGLGNMVYRSGYQVYGNPFYSGPFMIGITKIDYSRPICVQRSQYELLFESDLEKSERLRQQALNNFDLARRAFYDGNEKLAYTYVNQAIAIMPDDTSLHEFRALVQFSLGEYQAAAETMHAVLAVAPGWDWTTLSGLYRNNEIYAAQLRNLEQYVRLNPRVAAARFLLGYHYITIGYPDAAEAQLQAVLILKPEDRLSADLLALMREENQPDDQFAALRTTPLDESSFAGHWRAQRPNGEIRLNLKGDLFDWVYDLNDNQESFGGKFAITGNLMLLATSEGSQMVGTVNREDADHFTFRLLGASDNDPGVRFVRR